MKILSLIAFIGLSIPSPAQLIVSTISTNALGLAMQADNALLGHLTASTISFQSGGVTWTQVSNYSLGAFLVGNTPGGPLYADVTFLGRDSLRPNYFGVSNGATGYGTGGTSLFADYNVEDDFPDSYRVSAASLTIMNCWHFADKTGYQTNYFQDDTSSARTWVSTNAQTGVESVLLSWDDLHGTGPLVDDQDYNDGAFKIDFNSLPSIGEGPLPGEVAVPEASAFGLIGAAVALAAAYMRQRRQPHAA